LSAFDPAHLPDHDGKIVVYHCASGGRTSRFGAQLVAACRAAQDVFHMDGGIMAWKSAGFATEG
jgi:rhodanese-related sulfurtransferase